MRVLFITNQRKTEFYEPLAKKLRDRGAVVHWISLNKRWTRYLITRGWPTGAILCLEQFGPEWSDEADIQACDLERVLRIEKTAETSFGNIILMDRELCRKDPILAKKQIAIQTREIESFVLNNNIQAGLGEDTWATELITSSIMLHHNRKYFVPHTIRLPSNRFAFFTTVFHHSIETRLQPEMHSVTIAESVINKLSSQSERPYYFASRKNPHRLRWHWIEEAFAQITRWNEGKFDHSIPPLLTRSGRRARAIFRSKRIPESIFESPEPSAPFVFITLHLQPESSIDVYGNSLSNQVEIIRAMSRIMPFDWEIWVKEHPHAVGNWPASFYRQLKKIPGVRLIHFNADSLEIARKASLVASVSGTASMEAAALGVPALTFAPMVFGEMLLRNGFNPFAASQRDFHELIDDAHAFRSDVNRKEKTIKALSRIVANSFEGLFSDPISFPECISEENLAKVADACVQIFGSVFPTKAVNAVESFQ